MGNIHVKLERIEAIDAKKEILSCEAGILELIKKIRQYKNLRLREISAKNNLKTSVSKLKNEVKKIKTILPKPEGIKHPVERIKLPKQEDGHNRDIDKQLNEIKSKLARLSA